MEEITRTASNTAEKLSAILETGELIDSSDLEDVTAILALGISLYSIEVQQALLESFYYGKDLKDKDIRKFYKSVLKLAKKELKKGKKELLKNN